MLTLHNIEHEVRRVFSDTGERPQNVYVDVESYRNLTWAANARNFGYRQCGMQVLRYVGAFGEVTIYPDKHLPPDTVWAGCGDYASYWARRILLNDG